MNEWGRGGRHKRQPKMRVARHAAVSFRWRALRFHHRTFHSFRDSSFIEIKFCRHRPTGGKVECFACLPLPWQRPTKRLPFWTDKNPMKISFVISFISFIGSPSDLLHLPMRHARNLAYVTRRRQQSAGWRLGKSSCAPSSRSSTTCHWRSPGASTYKPAGSSRSSSSINSISSSVNSSNSSISSSVNRSSSSINGSKSSSNSISSK